MPGRDDQKENGHVLPAQQRPVPQPRLVIKHRQQKNNRRRINHAEQTFGQACKGRANPKSSEPNPAMSASLITAYCTENRPCDERADDRFGHDDAPEEKCAAEAEINQARNKAVPITRELFPNQKNQRNQRYDCNRDGKPGSCLVYTEDFERNDNEPVQQGRLLQARNAAVRWQEPLMTFAHLASGSGT